MPSYINLITAVFPQLNLFYLFLPSLSPLIPFVSPSHHCSPSKSPKTDIRLILLRSKVNTVQGTSAHLHILDICYTLGALWSFKEGASFLPLKRGLHRLLMESHFFHEIIWVQFPHLKNGETNISFMCLWHEKYSFSMLMLHSEHGKISFHLREFSTTPQTASADCPTSQLCLPLRISL